MNSLSSFNCNKSIIGKFINRSYSSTTQSKTELGNVVSVKAYYVARGIDIMRIHSDLYRSCRQEFQAKSLTITLDEVGHQYITMFKYGSVIMYNLPEEQHLDHLRNIKSAAHTLIDEGLFHTEDYEILVTESLGTPAVVKGEYLHLGNLDSHNVAMISEIMAQTVALDYYADVVDKMLAMFMQMNSNVEATGNFKSMKDQALLKLIASNNTVMTNVLSQVILVFFNDFVLFTINFALKLFF